MNEENQAVEPSESTGLLDGVTATEESQDSEPKQETIEHRAADSIPDDEPLERPDWWPENFWKKDENEPDLEAIAKSWTDMRKIVSQGKHKAPPDGKYDTSALGENIDSNPLAAPVIEWAKDHGISQAAFDSLITRVNEVASELSPPDAAVDSAAELKALGPNAQAVVNGMVNWARGLVNKGVWGPEDFEEFKNMGGTAKGLKALMKVRQAYEGRIPVESVPLEGAMSDEELQSMVGDPKYLTDSAYRKKVERMFAQRYN
jgi:hypothetical protein